MLKTLKTDKNILYKVEANAIRYPLKLENKKNWPWFLP